MIGELSISEAIYTAFSLLFLLLGIALLVTIIMSTANPYEQVTFANVEKLRASMNQVCTTGQESTIKFDMPQNTPIATSLLPVMPIWMIRTNGDPNYVLYYESFPAGDAAGWEVYQGMQNRIVAPVTGADGKDKNYVDTFATTVTRGWSSLRNEPLEGIVINNIILGNNRADYRTNTESAPANSINVGPELPDLTKYGEWKNKVINTDIPEKGDNEFVFKNYMSLTSFSKSAIKYEPCGARTLCLKTRYGVYTFPLDQCKDIKYVELKYDARNRKAVYIGLGAVVVVVPVGYCILSTLGGCAALIGAGGTVEGGAAALAGAAEILPSTYAAATVAEAAAGTAEAFPVFIESTGVGSELVASTTAAAEASTGSGLLSSIASFFARSGWRVAWLWTKQLVLHPLRTTVITIGTGVTTSFGIYKIGEFFGSAFLSYKVQDFNIESPCSISEMTIKKVDCNALDCKTAVSYPVYHYGSDGKLASDGIHYTCAEKIGTDINTPDNEGFRGGNCLQATVTEKAGRFCWTPDPYKNTWTTDTQYIADTLGFFPVKQSTSYISNFKAVVLKFYSLGALESWKDWSERRLSWGWPG